MIYTAEQLRTLFQNKFNLNEWTQFLINYIGAQTIRQVPEQLELNPSEGKGYYLGQKTTTDNYVIGLFYVQINSSVRNRRVGLRQIVKPYLRYLVDAALVVFDDSNNWRLSLVCDIKGESTSPKRYTFVFGDNSNYYNTAVSRFVSLQNKDVNFDNLKEAFSVEALSFEFYKKLFRWYMWAIDEQTGVTFPNRTDTDHDDREDIQRKMIRLITRLLFVWFIKQKHLVPNKLFDEHELQAILHCFDPQSRDNGNYYNAILQNLFFATLNQEISDRRFIEDKVFQGKSEDYGDKVLYRDNKKQSWFSYSENEKKQKVINLFHSIPYLNGGLFECLDKFDIDPVTGRMIPRTFYDGFSSKDTKSPNGNLKYRAFIPNVLFFAPEHKEMVDMGNGKRECIDVCGLIEIFRQYNFTTEENTTTDAEVSLDPELLGKVFENLLAAYNPETKEGVRKSTGSYYTPREIVDYMVDESLIAYLTEQCGHDAETIRLLFKDDKASAPANAMQIADDLRAVKVLDPACGSGAFPMGILLRVTNIIERLEPHTFNRYETKLALIKNCIYGIDIQPIAMLICKLRFFISLICDSEYKPDDVENNYGIIPLPNLETKFVAANSLLPAKLHEFEKDMNNDLLGDFELKQMQQKLLELRRTIFDLHTRVQKQKNKQADQKLCQQITDYIKRTALQPDEARIERCQVAIQEFEEELTQYKDDHLKEIVTTGLFGEKMVTVVDLNKQKRNELLARIRSCQAEIQKEKNKSVPQGFAEAVEQVTLWNPYDQNQSAPFFDAKWMFGIGVETDSVNSRATKQGFDIVIGNPPYNQLKRLPEKELYKRCSYKTYDSNGDIYCLFYEFGVEQLKQKGNLIYITSNKWMKSNYGGKLRNYVCTYSSPRLIIDLGDGIFESASVDTNIALLLNELYENATNVAKLKSSLYNLEFKPVVLPKEGIWNLFNDSLSIQIKNKIEQIKTRLTDFNVELNYGILTGANPVFILSKEKANALITLDKKNKEVIKPILRGKDLGRYCAYFSDVYLLCTHNGVKVDNVNPINIETNYPTLINYFRSFGEKFINRGEQGDHYYNLRNCTYIMKYMKPKILYADIVQECGKFYLDRDGYYTNDTAFMIYGDNLSYLLGILNSKAFSYFYKSFYCGSSLGKKGLRFKKDFLLKVPIPKVSAEKESIIINLVEDILSKKKVNPKANTLTLENEIDKLVYSFYSLVNEEIQLIEQT